MTRIFAFVGLLALQFVIGSCDQDEPEVLLLSEGYIMRLKAPPVDEKVTQCFITTNANKTYEIFPKKEFPSFDGNDYHCGLDARDIEMSYAGVWKMETRTAKTKFVTEFIIKMTKTVLPKPTNYINAAAGQWATVWLDSERDDVKVCNLKKTGGGQYDLLHDEVEGITRVGRCGVRMLLSNAMDGQWELEAQYGDYLIKTSTFQIVIPYSNDDKAVSFKHWKVGDKATLNDVSSRLGVPFCQFTRPDGTKVPLIFGSCIYTIPAISLYHAGIWKILYAKSNQMEPVEAEIHVTVSDPNLLEISATPGPGRSVNLLCRTGKTNMRFCTFIRPDRHIINVPAGIGNEKYSYYGKGYQDMYSTDRQYGECGLTIHNPSNVDFGLWTCELGIEDTVRGAVIEVKNSRAADFIRVTDNPKVFVKRGDDFKIKCSANAVLSYCWLTSPNGKAYSVSETEGDSKTLKYDGKGFSMGACGAIVRKANDTDEGQWTCHLGIVGGGEVEETVAVKVTDTYLIANDDKVDVEPNPTMSCRTFLGEEGSIGYCRWVRPNGHGINKEDAWRYELKQKQSECSLTVRTVEPDDIGQWRCVASLVRASSTEEWATVELVQTTKDAVGIASTLCIVLGSGLLVVTLIGAFFVAMHFYKKRNARVIKSPPPYYPQDYVLPHSIHTGPEPPIEKKDCAY